MHNFKKQSIHLGKLDPNASVVVSSLALPLPFFDSLILATLALGNPRKTKKSSIDYKITKKQLNKLHRRTS